MKKPTVATGGIDVRNGSGRTSDTGSIYSSTSSKGRGSKGRGRGRGRVGRPREVKLNFPSSSNSNGQMNEEQLEFCKNVLEDLLRNKLVKVWFTGDPRGFDNYANVIKNPMWINKITENLENHIYQSIEDFFSDICLVFRNAMRYNTQTSEGYKVSAKQLQNIETKYKQYMPQKNKISLSDTRLTHQQYEERQYNEPNPVPSVNSIDVKSIEQKEQEIDALKRKLQQTQTDLEALKGQFQKYKEETIEEFTPLLEDLIQNYVLDPDSELNVIDTADFSEYLKKNNNPILSEEDEDLNIYDANIHSKYHCQIIDIIVKKMTEKYKELLKDKGGVKRKPSLSFSSDMPPPAPKRAREMIEGTDPKEQPMLKHGGDSSLYVDPSGWTRSNSIQPGAVDDHENTEILKMHKRNSQEYEENQERVNYEQKILQEQAQAAAREQERIEAKKKEEWKQRTERLISDNERRKEEEQKREEERLRKLKEQEQASSQTLTNAPNLAASHEYDNAYQNLYDSSV